MLRVGITGGAGFIGGHLTKELLRLGFEVTVLDNGHHGRLTRPELRGASRIKGDIRSSRVIAQAFSNVDFVVNLAAESNVMKAEKDPLFAMSVSEAGTLEVANFCAQRGIPLLHASSREVYGDVTHADLPIRENRILNPKNVYGRSKAVAEVILARYPLLESTILRFSNVIGEGDLPPRLIPNWLLAVSENRPLTIFGGTQEIDFVRVQTVVEVIIYCINNPARREPINVGGGRRYTLLGVAETFQQIWPTASVDIQPARSAEVTCYQADIKRLLDMMPHLYVADDPLTQTLAEIAGVMA